MSIKNEINIGSIYKPYNKSNVQPRACEFYTIRNYQRKANSFSLSQNTIVAPESATLFTDEE